MTTPTDQKLREALLAYPRALSLRAAASKSSMDLVELDEWYRGELKELLETRKSEDKQGRAFLTSAELGRLMQWKLARGKWRPRLVDLALSNPDSVVRSTVLEASIAPADRALKMLSILKGVGPATASAILAVLSPNVEPFMSDEAMEGVSGGRKADYTPKAWILYREEMRERVETGKWEMTELEKAFWSWAILRRYEGADSTTGKAIATKKGGKRKSEALEQETTAVASPPKLSARANRAAKKAKAS